ncbi:hypothetical protein GE21DRAFT_1204562 [Neurospora crassa]|nr:hypothetical protein GE21DRAFT_1204562 [Neurospora crassa]
MPGRRNDCDTRANTHNLPNLIYTSCRTTMYLDMLKLPSQAIIKKCNTYMYVLYVLSAAVTTSSIWQTPPACLPCQLLHR